MSDVVLALAGAVLCASGCTWYLPAVADLRAGDDRPSSRRLAARACLTGWTTCLLVTVLMCVPGPRQALFAVAGVGAAATVLLRLRAGAHHRAERRETRACWAALGHTPPGAGTGASPRAFLVWILCGAALASAAGAALLLLADATTAVATALTVTGAALATAAARARPGRGPHS